MDQQNPHECTVKVKWAKSMGVLVLLEALHVPTDMHCRFELSPQCFGQCGATKHEYRLTTSCARFPNVPCVAHLTHDALA